MATSNQHTLIRTKAVKCSKVVNVNIPLFSNDYNQTKFGNSNASDQSITPSSAMNVDIDSIDFLVDFDINELLQSDAPIPDFGKILEVDENGDQNINGKFEINGFNFVDEVDDHQLHLNSKPVDDETRIDDFSQQATETMDLRSIALYLNLEDHEWID
ncbi:hypothetical protein CCACVL1_00385 [Corchorus capsularis]|uniref:Uncharacterized protein n=1 Tax=Corchorus capsularis TaxID=210143 RepID=A0A1R3KX63_COCAP|nr:hypothetical protein CCACVL1_00385 [Corchorus capsularis]